MEIWKPVVGYETRYEVSNLGNIRSTYFRVKRNKKLYQDKIYPRLILQIKASGKTKALKVHRVVAQAFIPNPENKPCVNHIDNNSSNNSVSNLEWCTLKENTAHCVKSGRHNFFIRNPRNHFSKNN